jgi:large subunit ribosomal protein L43
MSSRGILQLQRVKLSFCDWGGSSQGVRKFFKQDDFYNHVNSHPSINFEFHLRRGRHPFITAIYANGWEKDISLRNMSEEEVLGVMKHIKSNCKELIN